MIQLYYIYMILHPVTDKLLQFHCKMAKAPHAQIVFELPPSFQFPGNWACVWHENFCKKLLWMKQSFQYLQRVGLFWSYLPVLPGSSRSWFLNTFSLDLWPPSSWTLEIQLRVNTSFISITFRTYVTISYWRVHSCTIWRSVKVLWWLEHFLAARCAFSDRNPITLDSSEKKNPSKFSSTKVLHIFISKCPLSGRRMTHSNSEILPPNPDARVHVVFFTLI